MRIWLVLSFVILCSPISASIAQTTTVPLIQTLREHDQECQRHRVAGPLVTPQAVAKADEWKNLWEAPCEKIAEELRKLSAVENKEKLDKVNKTLQEIKSK